MVAATGIRITQASVISTSVGGDTASGSAPGGGIGEEDRAAQGPDDTLLVAGPGELHLPEGQTQLLIRSATHNIIR